MPAPVRAVVERIGENCEPSLCTVLFMAGAGGSLRAGVTENPVLLTRSVAKGETRVTMGGAPVYVWPGGGITVMVDVTRMPKQRLRLRADAGHRRAAWSSRCRARSTSASAATRPTSSPSADVIREVAPRRPHRALARRQPLAVRG